ncbi:hypothetical protein [Parasitella parasitica]|uniref:Integrase zinc-binding domain-containing protein n=1 Tax=Parasitella parasitica TaxID=35722 RepID=A0A0B7NNW9_9FUNG|nr:hypothetical protein [Parasitella parasitica]
MDTTRVVCDLSFLYWSVINGKLMPDGRKLNNIAQWPAIKTDRQLASFLGLMSYFRSSIPCYSRLTKDLDSLKQYKDLAAVWNESHTTDSSLSAIGGMLYQIVDDQICYVGLVSRNLTVSERNYTSDSDSSKPVAVKASPLRKSDTTSAASKKLHDELIFRTLRFADYITPPASERDDMIISQHLLGHFGIKHVENAIHTEGFHWKNLCQDIGRILGECIKCNKFNIAKEGYNPFRSNNTALPLDGWWMDLGDMGVINIVGIDRILALAYNPLGNCTAESYIKLTKATTIKLLNADYSKKKPTDSSEIADEKIINERYCFVQDVLIPTISKRIIDTQAVYHAKFAKKHKVVESPYPIDSSDVVPELCGRS